MLVMEELKNISENVSFFDASNDVSAVSDPDYQFITDIWVGIVLTLMVLSCVCCMCSCVLYHKFQQWKMNAIQARNQINLEAGCVEAELPSYTIASGLPTYQEALEQLKKVKEMTRNQQKITTEITDEVSKAPLSVITLFQLHNKSNGLVTKPS